MQILALNYYSNYGSDKFNHSVCHICWVLTFPQTFSGTVKLPSCLITYSRAKLGALFMCNQPHIGKYLKLLLRCNQSVLPLFIQ